MPTKPETGPWDDALNQLRDWDPAWAETCAQMATSPWRSGVLSRKLVELISVGLNAACTDLNAEGTRRHIRKYLPHVGLGRPARQADQRERMPHAVVRKRKWVRRHHDGRLRRPLPEWPAAIDGG